MTLPKSFMKSALQDCLDQFDADPLHRSRCSFTVDKRGDLVVRVG